MTARSVIITGASSGIGAAVAQRFLDKGWHVGLLARRVSRLNRLAEGRKNAYVLPADVTDPAAVDAAFDAFTGRVGRLDVLFNNAGMFGPSAPIDEVPLDDWWQVMQVNLHGMFICARAAFGRMRGQSPRGGRIINNGSISAQSPRPGSVCYTTTKHAITGLTKSLSLDGRAFDITCSQIDIGNARTDMVDDLNSRLRLAQRPVQPTMDIAQVADSVQLMAEMPPEANVQFMTVMASKMPYIGRG